MFKRIGLLSIAAIVALVCLGISERSSILGVQGLISTAEAVVGRPLSPVSVAGVARRSARRCAAGVTCY
jgi:hypothetical protein